MRLKRVVVSRYPDRSDLEIEFATDETRGVVGVPLPANWGEMDRTERLAYVRSAILAHLQDQSYVLLSEVLYPDLSAPDDARTAFEELPGWATWTPLEAQEWILVNVTDLQTARLAMSKMARAIMYLRDIVIDK